MPCIIILDYQNMVDRYFMNNALVFIELDTTEMYPVEINPNTEIFHSNNIKYLPNQEVSHYSTNMQRGDVSMSQQANDNGLTSSYLQQARETLFMQEQTYQTHPQPQSQRNVLSQQNVNQPFTL